MDNIKYCPVCEEQMEFHDTHGYSFGKSNQLTIHEWKCPACGEIVSDGPSFEE